MRGTYLRVGALALLAVAMVVGAVLFAGSGQVRHGLNYETYFNDSVQGLDVGAPVKYRGVAVGQVTAIGLVNAEYGSNAAGLSQDPALRLVLVRLVVDSGRFGAAPPPETLVHEGLRARIAPQGLTGQSYVELDFMDAARFPPLAVQWTPRDVYIPSAQSTLSQVTEGATVLLAKLAKVDVAGLAEGLQGLIADLHGVLRDGKAAGVMTDASDTLRIVRVALTAADIPALVAELRQTLADARALAQGPQTRELLRTATQATERLTQIAARLPPLLATLQDVARRADGGAADAEAGLVPLLRDARAALAALRQTTEAVRQDPAQIVLQGPPPRGLPR